MQKDDLNKWEEIEDQEDLSLNDINPAEPGETSIDVNPATLGVGKGVLDLDAWGDDESGSPTAKKSLTEMLLIRGQIKPAQRNEADKMISQARGRREADILIEMGIDPVAVQECAAEQENLDFQRIDIDNINVHLLKRLGVEYCKQEQMIPIGEVGNRILLGVCDPRKAFIIDDVSRRLKRAVKITLITPQDIEAIVSELTEEPEDDISIDDILADIDVDDVEVVEKEEDDLDLEAEAGQSPVIKFVNKLIRDAVDQGASDIHIEPAEKSLRVRYRIDGILFHAMNPPHKMHAAIVSRLKIMANLDISERRLPQDGRIRAMVGNQKLDLRLSTLPTGQGEKAVLRVLDGRSVQVQLHELGMPEDTRTMWEHQIAQPHGIILVTGPTGSGKTTTLYSSLNQMDRNRLNISTVEDPIEYHLGAITQVQTHEMIGMTFAAALRSLLRQDPDVVMVGEIRDQETSKIAIQAALTGHLVLSTLHTNDAPSSITRLINIGVEPFLIGAAMNAVLAQRLVRRICTNCKTHVKPTEEVVENLGLHGIAVDKVCMGEGCEKCHDTGYAGRVGLYELLILDDTTRDAIARRPNVTEFRRLCVERGMKTLRVDGFEKVADGQTTVEEVLRVTQSTI